MIPTHINKQTIQDLYNAEGLFSVLVSLWIRLGELSKHQCRVT